MKLHFSRSTTLRNGLESREVGNPRLSHIERKASHIKLLGLGVKLGETQSWLLKLQNGLFKTAKWKHSLAFPGARAVRLIQCSVNQVLN